MGESLWYIAIGRKFNIVYDWIGRVDFVDKLLVRFHLHHEADDVAMRFFNEHKEYDSMIVSSDDVLGTPDNVRMLLEDEEKNNFPVVSGWCNVLIDKPWAAVSMGANRQAIRTKVVRFEDYNFITVHDIILAKYGYPYFKAWFTGMPLTLIKREVLEKFPLRPFRMHRDPICHYALDKDIREGRKARGVMQDFQFACDCAVNKVPITIDARIFLLHFGFMGLYLKIGEMPRSVEFVKATKTRK